MTRKRGVYYYRRRLPKPHKGEVTLSLRTKAFRYAEHLASVLDQSFQQHLKDDDNTMTTDLRAILRQKLQEALWTCPLPRQSLRLSSEEATYGKLQTLRVGSSGQRTICTTYFPVGLTRSCVTLRKTNTLLKALQQARFNSWPTVSKEADELRSAGGNTLGANTDEAQGLSCEGMRQLLTIDHPSKQRQRRLMATFSLIGVRSDLSA